MMQIIMRKNKKATETFINAPKCDAPDCLELGLYKAPKRKGGGAKEYYHFCLPHVQQFNKNYDFFAGMDEDAIINFRHEAITGHRPTWKIGDTPDLRLLELENALEHFLHFAPKQTASLLPKEIRVALDIFELTHPCALPTIKTQYKILVKKYHPDINKNANAAEKFNQITNSYHILIEHYKNLR
jgi:hypothetical protein